MTLPANQTQLEPAVSITPVSAATDRLRVAGVALGRFAMVDGRPPDQAWYAAELVAHFQPGTVPLVSRHGGVAFGTLDTLTADGPDLHFTGSMVDYPDLIERLRHGHAISIEVALAQPLRPDGVPRPGSVKRNEQWPYFTGIVHLGACLTGIALTDNPAARGSVIWIVKGDGNGY